jgi:hypothetical protein
MATGAISGGCCESVADRVVSVVAMTGAVGGAICGAVLAAEDSSVFRAVCGMVGTVLGSGMSVAVWGLLSHFWPGNATGQQGHSDESHAAQS